MEELQRIDLNPTEHLWDELEFIARQDFLFDITQMLF